MAKHNVIDADLERFGWKTFLQQRRGTSSLTLNKLVVTGAGLGQGQTLYCYLGKDRGRKVIIIYMDGKPRNPG